jgi:hypothetical protein
VSNVKFWPVLWIPNYLFRIHFPYPALWVIIFILKICPINYSVPVSANFKFSYDLFWLIYWKVLTLF